jgi:hypothetical protein
MRTRELSRLAAGHSRRQRGAALFVAMMILIILSLMAVSASQVTVLQERMVQAYWSDFQAFESTEDRLREWERQVKAQVEATECPVIERPPIPAWMRDGSPVAADQFMANVQLDEYYNGRSGIGGENAMGTAATAIDCLFFIVAAADNDVRNDADASSWAVVQSVFVP